MTWQMLSGHTLEQFLAIPGLLGVPDSGDAFEAALVATHHQYLADRRAFVIKLAVPKGYDRKRNFWFPKAKTACDFIGWTASGRPVAFDAKRHGGPRWRYSDAKAHQWRSLKMVKDMGGLAFFLILHDGVAYIISPSAVTPGKGVALVDYPAVRWDGCWDWLSKLENGEESQL